MAPLSTRPQGEANPRPPAQRWRLVIRRRADAPLLAHRDWLAAWEAALLLAGLPIAGLDATAPRPRIVAAAPLATGLAAEAELIDVLLTERVPRWRIREAIEARLPDGNDLVDVHDVWLGEAPLPGRVAGSEYIVTLELEVEEVDRIAAALAGMLAAGGLPRARAKGDRTVAYDLRPFLGALTLSPLDAADHQPDAAAPSARYRLTMHLLHDPEKGIGRPDEVLAELGSRVGRPLEGRDLTRTRMLLRNEHEEGSAASRHPTGVAASQRPRGQPISTQPGGRRGPRSDAGSR
jgi:radical SAM-linked protein